MDEGSSPLARGTQDGPPPGPCRAGLIPARAGNTAVMKAWAVTWRAHPRSRGEHANSSTTKKFRRGSSPLARGTQEIIEDDKYCLGLIPARAGNTGYGFCGADHAWAHPRSRGEHLLIFEQGERGVGSSPLARGTHGFPAEPAGVEGLIPARAGNTTYSSLLINQIRAHPRSRGEHDEPIWLMSVSAGSSPLARGTRGFSRATAGGGGLIPARAGNTEWLTDWLQTGEAHPRSRGEHT